MSNKNDSNELSTTQKINKILDQNAYNENERSAQSDKANHQTLQFNGTDLFKKPSAADNNKTPKRPAPPNTTSTESSQKNDYNDTKAVKPPGKKSKKTHTSAPPDTLRTQSTRLWRWFLSHRWQRFLLPQMIYTTSLWKHIVTPTMKFSAYPKSTLQTNIR